MIICLLFYEITQIGYYLHHADVLKPSDVIIVIGGGGEERVKKGVELYKNGYAPKILFSGATIDANTSTAEIMAKYAHKQGITKHDIYLEPKSTNTYENAIFSHAILENQSLQNIILVTSSYHQKRAEAIFAIVFNGKNIISAPAEVTFWNPSKWWQNKKSFRLTCSEFIKLMWGKLTNIWG